ncbi:synaptonemal complex central element protein 1-like [Rana temporaria]|uniref:synaptonemal complex central element protein 1-like n=1 Tax=Rana temporaria TaxID=8407 RepID=UPI001AACB324|nr:synaptonemal complex central element protein 1-like [Rana temporaria]
MEAEAKNMDPKVEDLLTKINIAFKALEEMQKELQDLVKYGENAEEELQGVRAERQNLQEELEKKQESVQVLKLRYDSYLEKEKRQRERSEDYKMRINNLKTQIQEEKLKQRKQRMRFEDQLENLMTKHRNLAEFYNPKRLEEEISRLEKQKNELIQEYREKLPKLKEIKETEARLIDDGILTPENVFLHSEEAVCVVKMFEEENALVKTMLEKATARHSELLDNCNRLEAELISAEVKLSKTSGAVSWGN